MNTAEKILWDFSCKALVADEVGLGKTIEAGLVLKELLIRGIVDNVLILVPKALEHQWQLELFEKFGEAFSRFSEVSPARLDDASFATKLIAGHAILSHARAVERLGSRVWDLVIVDEAHRFSHQTSKMNRNLKNLKRSRTILLTATPLQNSIAELFELVRIIRPDLNPALLNWRNFALDQRGRLVRSSRISELRQVLELVMCRTRRVEAGVYFAERKVESVSLNPTDAERSLMNGVYQFLTGFGESSLSGRDRRLVRLAVLQSLSSHPVALAESLSKVESSTGYPNDFLRNLRRIALEPFPSAKESALVRILGSTSPSQAVIFVERLATGRHLAEELSKSVGSAEFYHGGLSSEERNTLVRRFLTGRTRYFISTSAGSEGLNLQNASLLVNFDLHWNPLRLEQRIGRVHRFGQRNAVRVVNLSTQGTVDDLVRSILFDKIDLFKLTIGEIESILTQFGDEFDFEAAIEDIVATSQGLDQIAERLMTLGLDVSKRIDEHKSGTSLSSRVLDEVTPQH